MRRSHRPGPAPVPTEGAPRLALALAAALALGLAPAAWAAGPDADPGIGPRVPAPTPELRDQMAAVREAVLPYVVSILVVREEFQQGASQLSLSGGSGTIVSAEGHVVTNAHVTDKGRAFRVVFGDGRELPATLVGEDPLSDLAVLRIRGGEGERFRYARFAETLDLRAGDSVVAIGAPWGMANSLSAGVVNNPRRLLVSIFQDEADHENRLGPDQPSGRYYAWIQHDAPISPGNSGGPLVDLAGRIVGVNTLGQFFGGDMAFAIPGPEAATVARQLIADGRVQRADFGMRLRSRSGSAFQRGVLVNSVRPEGPAAAAGLVPGDRIVALDGQPIDAAVAEDIPAIERRLAELPAGTRVVATIERGQRRFDARLVSEAASADRGREREIRAWGLTAVELTPAMAARRGLPYREGLVISGVRPGGAAATASPALLAGDVLRALDGRPLASLAAIADCGDPEGPGDGARLLEVDRQGATLVAALVPAPCERVREPQAELPKPWAGVMVQPVGAGLARLLGAPDRIGYRVTRVIPDTPFARAGGRVGDLVVAVDGEPVPVVNATDTTPFEQRIRNADDGEPLEFTVFRDGRERRLRLGLDVAPEPDSAMASAEIDGFGLRVRELSFFDRLNRRLPEDLAGVLVESVEPGGLAGLAHVARNDILLAVDGSPVADLDALRVALAAAQRGTAPSIVFTVRRDRDTRLLFLERDWLMER
jgi:serine protease Do